MIPGGTCLTHIQTIALRNIFKVTEASFEQQAA